MLVQYCASVVLTKLSVDSPCLICMAMVKLALTRLQNRTHKGHGKGRGDFSGHGGLLQVVYHNLGLWSALYTDHELTHVGGVPDSESEDGGGRYPRPHRSPGPRV